jgi:hypothetical protein
MKNVLQLAVASLTLAWVTGCTPGYIKASELEARGQGPAECARSCEALKMRMAALVLVGNDLPGCVCQPLPTQGAPLTQPQPPQPESALSDGAAASTTGYVVIAAAAAAREQQRRQQQLQQQQQQQKK